MVLGMQWFQSLGPVLTNYKALTMKFIREGHTVELKGDTNSSLHAITPFQLRCLIITDAVGDFFHLQIVPKELPLTQTTSPTFPPEMKRGITQPKRHDQELVVVVVCAKGCFLNAIFAHQYLMIAL